MKRVLSVLLSILIIASALPMGGVMAFAETVDSVFESIEFDNNTENEKNDKTENNSETEDVGETDVVETIKHQASLITTTNNSMTRAQWLHNLVYVFNMAVNEEAYPDNYFTDLAESHRYYEDILIAVEFGVVDIEAGGELRPDDPATREFAVSTLNFCLGYQLEEGTEYTFADSAECTYPESAQIAINRGWVELIDGNFSPDTTITDAEVKKMTDDATAVLEQSVIDDNHEDVIEFAEDVIVVPDGTVVTEDDSKVVSITDCPVAIAVGNKFAVYYNGIPVVYTAQSVTVEDNITKISTAEVEDAEAFEKIDIQGTVDSDAMEITPAEGVELTIEEDDSAVSTFASKKLKAINAKKTITLGNGVKATINAKIKNPVVEYDVSSNYSYVQLVGDAEITFSASVNLTDAAGISSITLFNAGVAGVGGFTVTLNLELSGKASGTVKGRLVAGLECVKGSDIRAIKGFTQTQYITTAEATAEISLKATLGVTELPVVNAYLYATVGMVANVKSTSYSSGTPHNCTHFGAYLYANYGASASVKFLGWSKSFNENYDIYTANNSPVRIVHHYEDGVEVAKCTRGQTYNNFFTHSGSRWGGCGWSGANGAYGLNADGTPFVLYEYELDEDNNATITQYNGNSWSVNIPSEIDGYTVTAIGSFVFSDKDVVYVTIPDTVTIIGFYAFDNCVYLKNITIPNSVTTIESGAFHNCVSLLSIDLPDNLEVINSNVFDNCSSLKSIVIPDSVTEIETWAFADCVSLKNVTLSKSLTYMGCEAFVNTAIESIEIPKSLTECGWFGYDDYELDGVDYENVIISGPFAYCENLKTVTFEKGTTVIAEAVLAGAVGIEKMVIPNTVTVIESYSFAGCVRLKDVTIGNSVTTIDDSAFENCISLSKVIIPDSVTKIGEYAFRYCISLPEITISDSVTTIERSAFENCSSLKDVTLSKSLKYMGYSAFGKTAIESIEIPKSLDECSGYWGDSYTLDGITYNDILTEGPFYLCESLKTVTFEQGTTQIASVLFGGAVGLEKVIIPDTVTIIENDAFYGCVRLTDVTIGNAVTTIGSYAFANCISLSEVVIPDSVTEINYYAFSKCFSLKNVTLSKALTYMGYGAFRNAAIESIEIPKSLDECGGYLGYSYTLDGVTYSSVLTQGPFYLCENLKTVTFEKGTTQIARSLFGGAVGLEKIVVPDTVTTIERDAFYGCVRLTDVTVGKAVTTIEPEAFENCISLPNIVIPDSVTRIDAAAFRKCISFKNIVIPDSVTSIGNYIFENCTSIESVKLPNNTKTITESMFRNCSSLKTIELPETVTKIQYAAFYNCTSLESIIFPDNSSLTEIQYYAFYNCSSLKEAILPENTKTIGTYAFKNCTSLEKVYIPQSTKTLGVQAFMGCEKLSNVTIADYSITKIETDTFKDCPGLVSIVLPKGLTTIGSQAFMNDTGLVSVTIPESVTSIDSTAFSYPAKTTIYGKTGSYAETFATEGGFKFVDNTIAVEGFILKDGVESITLDYGETYRAEFEFFPEDANEVVTLTASNTNVTINGMDIYARYTGDTVITATTTSGMTYEFTVHIRNASSISITTNPNKMTYIMGEELDLTGMVVQVNYNDGSTKEVTDYTVSGFDSSVEGTSTVTVKWVSPYGSTYTKTFTVEIVDPTPKVTSIYVGALPTKTSYELREKLDLTGLVIMANYTDGSTGAITDYTVSGYNALKAGTQTITVTSGDFTTTFTVTVGETKTLESIAIGNTPDKIIYYIGDSLVTTGLELTLTYSDGSLEVVTSGFTTSGFSSTTVGTKTVTVTYQGLTATFTVTVKRPTISLSSATSNLKVGESTTLTATATPTNQTVTWSSSDTSVATVSNGVVIAVGEGTATITAKFIYNDTTYSKTCTVTVTEEVVVTLSSVAINSQPTKLAYTVGETFDSTGLSLKLTYSDGTTETITSGFTVSSPDMSTDGTKIVTVTYQGKSTTFAITVKEIPVASATIKVESQTATVGKQVTVPVIVEDTDLGVLTIEINYDSTKLNFVSLNDVSFDMYDINTDTAGVIRISAIDGESVPAGIILNLTFDIIAEEGCNTEISVVVIEAFDGSDNEVEMNVINGTIEILDIVMGDVNGDGKYSAIDARWTLQYSAGNKEFTDDQIAAADVNGDGKVSAIDARWILQASAGNRVL